MTALRALVTIGLAGLWLLICVPPMFQTPPRISAGVHLIVTGALVQPNRVRVDRGSPAYRAGLRTGDVLGCLSPRDANLLLWNETLGNYQAAYRRGTLLSTCVRRNGTMRPIHFTARTGSPVTNAYGSNAFSAFRVCVFLVFLLTGVALVMARPSLMTWIFFGYCIGSAPTSMAQKVLTVLPAWQHAIALGVIWCSAPAVAFLLLFSILVPSETIPNGWRRIAFTSQAL
jgi:hypothetical protein